MGQGPTFLGGMVVYLIPLVLQAVFGLATLIVLVVGVRKIRRELRDGFDRVIDGPA